MLVVLSRDSLNAADDRDGHAVEVEVDARRKLVAVIDEIVMRRGYLPRIELGGSWMVREGAGGRELALVVQNGSWWDSAVPLMPVDTEVVEIRDTLHFEYQADRD